MCNKKGQSLVEVALFLPIVVFMMIGVLEVGATICSYMVLLNASRETARFAIRPEYLQASGEGIEDVIAHVDTTLAHQLPVSNTVVTVFDINVGVPFIEGVKCPFSEEVWPDCDCETLVAISPYTISIYSHATGFELTQLDPFLPQRLARAQDVSNCRIAKNGLVIRPIYQVVAVELFYDHDQMFGFPLISNPYTDPVPLYAYTIMRKHPMRRSPFTEDQ